MDPPLSLPWEEAVEPTCAHVDHSPAFCDELQGGSPTSWAFSDASHQSVPLDQATVPKWEVATYYDQSAIPYDQEPAPPHHADLETAGTVLIRIDSKWGRVRRILARSYVQFASGNQFKMGGEWPLPDVARARLGYTCREGDSGPRLLSHSPLTISSTKCTDTPAVHCGSSPLRRSASAFQHISLQTPSGLDGLVEGLELCMLLYPNWNRAGHSSITGLQRRPCEVLCTMERRCRSECQSTRHALLAGAAAEVGVEGGQGPPRLRWTQELHDCFAEAVAEMGGLDAATPKVTPLNVHVAPNSHHQSIDLS